jgi:predicted Zn-dependent peptidase
MMPRHGLLALLAALVLGGCPTPRPPPPENGKKPAPPVGSSSSEAFGERPRLRAPQSYEAPTPQVYQTPQGISVWLIERRGLPVVSFVVVTKRGSQDDPAGTGLAHITAAMLDEGAGTRDALAISSAINDLGASLGTSVDTDGSRISLTVLKKHLDKAFPILADIVARPRFEEKEWQRVHKLWVGQLKRRGDDPAAVARVVSSAVLYGPDTAYGHPTTGLVASAEGTRLPEVKAFYRRTWRPAETMLVAVGDIGKSELDALIAKHLGDWQAKGEASPAIEPTPPLAKRPKLVLVDRDDAPQSVVSIVGAGITAKSPDAPLLDLVNTALGGSFTSRLNQNLREDRGWSYGAGSRLDERRGVGPFVAISQVFTNVTGSAVGEILKEIRAIAKEGLSGDEYIKVRSRALADTIQTYETVEGVASRLSTLAMLGLPPAYDSQASRARQQATRTVLAKVAAQYLRADDVSIVVVGPKKEVLPQLGSLGFGDPEPWSVEGKRIETREPR